MKLEEIPAEERRRARDLAVPARISRRDLFAAFAMAGLLIDAEGAKASEANEFAECAVECADALIAALDGVDE